MSFQTKILYLTQKNIQDTDQEKSLYSKYWINKGEKGDKWNSNMSTGQKQVGAKQPNSEVQFIAQITKDSLTSNLKGGMSVLKTLADHYGVDNKTEVRVKPLEDTSKFELDKVYFTIKDQFLSRRDQWYF